LLIFDIVCSEFACSLMADASLKIGQIDVRVKTQQGLCLATHLTRRPGCELAHAVGDQILDRDNGEGGARYEASDQQKAIPIRQPIERRAPHDLETHAKFGVNPPSRRAAGPRGADEALALQFLLQFRLDGGAEIEIASVDSA
jgi:hypothetical protein